MSAKYVPLTEHLLMNDIYYLHLHGFTIRLCQIFLCDCTFFGGSMRWPVVERRSTGS